MTQRMKSNLASGSFTLFACLLAAASFGAVAHEASTREQVTLVRLKPDPSAVSLTARLEGKLQVHNGCVYLVSKKDKRPRLAIWPSTYRLLSSAGKAIGVADALSGKSLKFGVNAVFGGGEANTPPADMLDAPMPSACGGDAAFVEFSY